MLSCHIGVAWYSKVKVCYPVLLFLSRHSMGKSMLSCPVGLVLVQRGKSMLSCSVVVVLVQQGKGMLFGSVVFLVLHSKGTLSCPAVVLVQKGKGMFFCHNK